jgi:uncharacterized RDD family membrane protein YckC
MERAGESILGLDNIELELPVAGIGSRTLAAVLDYVCLGLLYFGWTVLCVLSLFPWSVTWGIAGLVAGYFALEWGFFAGFEVATGGRTPGKMAMKLRAVSAEGGRAGAGALLIRNLVRSIDLLLGLPLMVFDLRARRLGDRLAGTLVVHERPPELAAGRGVLLGRVPPGWGAREVSLVESFLARAGDLADRDAMALQILGRIRADAPEMLAGITPSADPVREIRRALAAGEG